jgi:hypothetical protein
MSDRTDGRASGQARAVPRPPRGGPAAEVRRQGPGVPPSQRSERRRPGSGRSVVRAELDAALSGAALSTRDMQFLDRLVHWDKRNGTSVASLLWRARKVGRDEAGLTNRQLEIVISALEDAAVYRALGAETISCWDCEGIPGGRCAEHSRDADWARAYAELAAVLSAGSASLSVEAARLSAASCADQADLSADSEPTALPRPTDIAKYRRRTPVAS